MATENESRVRTGAHQDAFVFFRRTGFECQEDVAEQCREHHQSQERQPKGVQRRLELLRQMSRYRH